MPNVSGGGWLRTIDNGVDNGVVIPAFVSPESARVRTYEGGPSSQRAVKVVCGKGTNWLLFGTDFVPKLWRVEHLLTINIKEEAS